MHYMCTRQVPTTKHYVWEISQQSGRSRVRLPVNLKGPLKGPDLFITQTIPISHPKHLICRIYSTLCVQLIFRIASSALYFT